jgi:hypothetical protein
MLSENYSTPNAVSRIDWGSLSLIINIASPQVLRLYSSLSTQSASASVSSARHFLTVNLALSRLILISTCYT